MIRKEHILGRETTFERTLLQELRNFFGVRAPESPSIPFYSKQYRTIKKKIVSEGRLTQWKPVTTGKEKEAKGLKRIQERNQRRIF